MGDSAMSKGGQGKPAPAMSIPAKAPAPAAMAAMMAEQAGGALDQQIGAALPQGSPPPGYMGIPPMGRGVDNPNRPPEGPMGRGVEDLNRPPEGPMGRAPMDTPQAFTGQMPSDLQRPMPPGSQRGDLNDGSTSGAWKNAGLMAGQMFAPRMARSLADLQRGMAPRGGPMPGQMPATPQTRFTGGGGGSDKTKMVMDLIKMFGGG